MILLLLSATMLNAVELPVGPAPAPVAAPHFPDRLHAFVWRNWGLVPPDRMAKVIGAEPADILELGKSMGLVEPAPVSDAQWRRSYITILRRNWHLLPYDQLLTLLDWSEDELAFCLREDDFLYIKFGLLKPGCEPLRYATPSEQARARARQMAKTIQRPLGESPGRLEEPLFHFVEELSSPPEAPPPAQQNIFSPRYCYSYFALYGDPLLDTSIDSYPDGYLARLAASGVGGVWLQGVLYKLAPFPWDEGLSDGWETRLQNLRALVARARTHGLGIYLYLNEPRAMPLPFFDEHPELKGVVEGDHATMCTSAPEVQDYIRQSVKLICERVPELEGIFTITASENVTNCWSHYQGAQCSRCSSRTPAEVIAEVNRLMVEGIQAAGSETRFIAWDWGWRDEWATDAIALLPESVLQMSVSEWSLPIRRGGIDFVLGEYALSAIGPGPRAQRHWAAARARGLKTMAKIQANNTWEISAVPYIPVVENVARHIENLRGAGVDGLMMSWTLGGYPSPNLEVVAEMGAASAPTVDEALLQVARRRFGDGAPAAVTAWKAFSRAFSEYPYGGGLYTAPTQTGPANLLWSKPTGYAATMVGWPYDDLDSWRGPYPADVFAAQFDKVADGFDAALDAWKAAVSSAQLDDAHKANLESEMRIADVCAIHFHSVANQTRFVAARDALTKPPKLEDAQTIVKQLEALLESEIDLARRLYAIQVQDSRIGFEASNQYYYVPQDLAEKILNCTDLLDNWLPPQRQRFGMELPRANELFDDGE